ncbi:uncharacterized protein PAC_06326 [Phialocephala subalpina]|uniref:Uncharacterized protein n=1 Tax=Phialocephala subalpina TaxID=576137 RepID=A0A1L7WUJ4_9HELO|nr:uncharacterized protein PAC_06326 [Phialocephala subalpina]
MANAQWIPKSERWYPKPRDEIHPTRDDGWWGPNYRHWDQNADLDDIGRSTYENQHQFPLATSSEAHNYHGGQYFSDDGAIPRANTAPPETQGDDRHLYIYIRDAWRNEQEAVALLDTGADDDWISTTLVNKLGHSVNTQVQKEALCGGNGIVRSEGTVVLGWRAGHRLWTTEFNVFDFDHHDVIFGHRFLRREKVITWNHSGLFPLVADKKASTDKARLDSNSQREHRSIKNRSNIWKGEGKGGETRAQSLEMPGGRMADILELNSMKVSLGSSANGHHWSKPLGREYMGKIDQL